MSRSVWVFKDGVYCCSGNRATEPSDGKQASSSRRKVLVHISTNEVITSHAALERKLTGLGWERYNGDANLLQFHRQSSVDLISLPRDFSRFKPMHMYDIVVKNRGVFEVRDM